MLGTVSIIADILLKLVQAAPAVMRTVEDLLPLANDIKDIAKGDEVTPEQKAGLDARIDALLGRLMEPLPPE